MSTPRRGGVGLSAFTRNTITSAQYASHGASLRSTHSSSLQAQLEVFQQQLLQFSVTHARDIRSNPQFRAEFARMCNAIGVDPLLASSSAANSGRGPGSSSAAATTKDGGGKNAGGGYVGNFWAQMLGGSINDFYFELAVRVVEVCRDTRAENGGMIAVGEVVRRVHKGRGIGGGMEVSECVYSKLEACNLQDPVLANHQVLCFNSDDVLRAVKALEPLGSGFTIKKLGAKQMIRSVPKELNTDQSTVLEVIQVLGYVTISMLQINLSWERARSVAVIDDLVTDSLVWIDKQAEETEYWSPTFIHDAGGQ